MSNYDQSLLFPDDMLVDYANFLLKEADKPISVTAVKRREDNFVQFTAEGARGSKFDIVAPMGSPKTGLAFFRSLLKVRPGVKHSTWLLNGQSSNGTSEIVFYGENGPWLATTIDNVRAYFQPSPSNVAEQSERLAAWANERVERALQEGFLTDEPQVLSWGDEHRREPLRPSDPALKA